MVSRMWWSLTGSLTDNILPLDWNSSRTRELHLKALNLPLDPRAAAMNNGRLDDNLLRNRMKKLTLSSTQDEDTEDSLDDEELAKDLDLHSLILNSRIQSEPIFTAEQVLEEIDEILTMHDHDDDGTAKSHHREKDWFDEDERDHEQSKSLGVGSSVCTTTDTSPSTDDASSSLHHDNSHCNQFSSLSAFSSLKTCGQPSLSSLMFEGKWKDLSIAELNEVLVEQEKMIQSYSEILIQELALRDELEFEKEVKNNFISLLLAIQNKRRQCSLDRKKIKSSPLVASSYMSSSASLDSMKYLTTVIPYDPESGPPDLCSLQVLMKSKCILLF